MFLNQLSKEEKNAFLDLALLIVNSDGDFSHEERSLINQYLDEMSMEVSLDEYVLKRDLQDILRFFKESGNQIVKKVFVEMVGLAFVDHHYDVKEREVVDMFMDYFDITNEDYKLVKNSVMKLSEAYEIISNFILDNRN